MGVDQRRMRITLPAGGSPHRAAPGSWRRCRRWSGSPRRPGARPAGTLRLATGLDLSDPAPEQLGDEHLAGRTDRETGGGEQAGSDLLDLAGLRVDPVDRGARTEARVLGAAGQRGDVQLAAGADLDVGGHRLEVVGQPDRALRETEALGDLRRDLQSLGRQHGDRGEAAVGSVLEDRVHGRVGDVGTAAILGGGVGVRLDDPGVGLEVRRHLAVVGKATQAVDDVTVGVAVLLELPQVGELLGLPLLAEAHQRGGRLALAALLGEEGRREAQAAVLDGDGADLGAGHGRGVDHLGVLAGPLGVQDAGEVLAVEDRAVVGDGEAQRAEQVLDDRVRVRLGGRVLGACRPAERSAGEGDGREGRHQVLAVHESSRWKGWCCRPDTPCPNVPST